MKVAFFVNAFPQLSETFIIGQIADVVREGHDVTIYALTRRPGVAQPLVDRYSLLECAVFFGVPDSRAARLRGALVHIGKGRIPPRLLKRPSLLATYKAEWLSLKLIFALAHFSKGPAAYDVVHCHFGPNGNLASALREAGLLRGPLLTSFHGLDASYYPGKWGTQVYQGLFRHGDLFTANSSFVRDKVIALGCSPARITLMPEGFDPTRFPFRERHAVTGGAINFLTIARLVEKKGLPVSLAAFSKVKAEFPFARYYIVGDGPQRRELEELIRASGLGGSVFLVGRKSSDEIASLAKKMHVFVLASLVAPNGDHEGQGLVLQEAQAMGMPVVATRHNGFPESVLEDSSAYLVPEGDAEALAERMLHLCRNPDLWPAMGARGAAFVERFDQARLTPRLMELYAKLCGSELPSHVS